MAATHCRIGIGAYGRSWFSRPARTAANPAPRQDRFGLRRCEASTIQRCQLRRERVVRRSLAKRLDVAQDRQALINLDSRPDAKPELAITKRGLVQEASF